MTNWALGIATAIKNFEERKRVYPSEFSLLLIDYLVKHDPANIQFLYKFLSSDFIETTIGHVTTAMHGPGSVPENGWYFRDQSTLEYKLHPEFVQAWKAARSGQSA